MAKKMIRQPAPQPIHATEVPANFDLQWIEEHREIFFKPNNLAIMKAIRTAAQNAEWRACVELFKLSSNKAVEQQMFKLLIQSEMSEELKTELFYLVRSQTLEATVTKKIFQSPGISRRVRDAWLAELSGKTLGVAIRSCDDWRALCDDHREALVRCPLSVFCTSENSTYVVDHAQRIVDAGQSLQLTDLRSAARAFAQTQPKIITRLLEIDSSSLLLKTNAVRIHLKDLVKLTSAAYTVRRLALDELSQAKPDIEDQILQRAIQQRSDIRCSEDDYQQLHVEVTSRKELFRQILQSSSRYPRATAELVLRLLVPKSTLQQELRSSIYEKLQRSKLTSIECSELAEEAAVYAISPDYSSILMTNIRVESPFRVLAKLVRAANYSNANLIYDDITLADLEVFKQTAHLATAVHAIQSGVIRTIEQLQRFCASTAVRSKQQLL